MASKDEIRKALRERFTRNGKTPRENIIDFGIDVGKNGTAQQTGQSVDDFIEKNIEEYVAFAVRSNQLDHLAHKLDLPTESEKFDYRFWIATVIAILALLAACYPLLK